MKVLKRHKKLIKICLYFLFFSFYLFSFTYFSGAGFLIYAQTTEIDSAETFQEADSLADTLMTTTEPDTSGIRKEEAFPEKSFIGTSKDIVIAGISVLTWLVFMWMAANSR